MSNSINRVMYLSKGRHSFTYTELVKMNERFAAKNASLGVTGVLLRVGNYFIQVVEGAEPTISELIRKIESDHRHSNFTILTNHMDHRRIFGQWSMNFIDLDSTYYVNHRETAKLREQIDSIVAGSQDMKRTFMALIVEITKHVRSSAPSVCSS